MFESEVGDDDIQSNPHSPAESTVVSTLSKGSCSKETSRKLVG